MPVDVTPVYQQYLKAQLSFDTLLQLPVPTDLAIGLFDEDMDRPLPMFIKDMSTCGAPDTLKYFREIRFYGNGDAWVRCMIDGILGPVTPDNVPVVMEQDPTGARVLNMPRGTCGYWIDIEFVTMGRFMFYEIIWDPVTDEKESE